MNRLLVTAAAAALLSAPAMAQVSDITGRVTGTVDQTTRLGADALGNEAVIDQRTGLEIDSRLHGQLDRALPRHDGGADAALQARLDADASAQVDGRSAGASMNSRGGMRADAQGRFAPVNVYASDGVLVGRAERLRRSGGQQHVVIRGSDRDRIEIPVEQAAFDASANAVVLAMTSAEMTGGAASAAFDGAADAAGAVEGAGQAATEAGARAQGDLSAHLRDSLPAHTATGAGGELQAHLDAAASGTLGSATGALGLDAQGGAAANGAVPVFSADGALLGHADSVVEVDGQDRLRFIGASSGQVETVAASQAAFNEQANAVVLTGARADYDASAGLQQ